MSKGNANAVLVVVGLTQNTMMTRRFSVIAGIDNARVVYNAKRRHLVHDLADFRVRMGN